MFTKSLLIGAAMVVPFTSFAAVLFDQTSNLETDGYFSDAQSSNGAYFYGQAMADDFTIAADSNVTSITFWGASENFTGDDNLDNIDSFDVVIYDASFNTIASYNFLTSALNPTATGAFGSFTGATGYTFTANVSQALAAGTYNVHFGAVLNDGFGDAFQWSTADGNNNLSADFFDGDGYTSFGQEPGVAFRVEGQPVPEPASMAALGLGIAAMVRRRRKSA